jgi:hypothetical protein
MDLAYWKCDGREAINNGMLPKQDDLSRRCGRYGRHVLLDQKK